MPTLDDIQPGQTVCIKRIADIDVATQAIRMGVAAGTTVVCEAKVPSGPVIIKIAGAEWAIGRALSQQIEVECQ